MAASETATVVVVAATEAIIAASATTAPAVILIDFLFPLSTRESAKLEALPRHSVNWTFANVQRFQGHKSNEQIIYTHRVLFAKS